MADLFRPSRCLGNYTCLSICTYHLHVAKDLLHLSNCCYALHCLCPGLAAPKRLPMQGLRIAAAAYFGVAAFFVLACFFLYALVLPRLPIIRALQPAARELHQDGSDLDIGRQARWDIGLGYTKLDIPNLCPAPGVQRSAVQAGLQHNGRVLVIGRQARCSALDTIHTGFEAVLLQNSMYSGVPVAGSNPCNMRSHPRAPAAWKRNMRGHCLLLLFRARSPAGSR